MKKETKKFAAFCASSAFLFVPLAASAEALIQPPFAVSSIQDLLQKLISVALQIGIPIMVLAIMFIGFQYVWEASKGREAKLGPIHENFKYTLLGAALMLGAYVILDILNNTFRALQQK